MGRTSFAVEGAGDGLSKFAAALMPNKLKEDAAYDDGMLKKTKIGAMLATMKAHQASADKEQAETNILTRRPDMYLEQVALAVPGATTQMAQRILAAKKGDPSTEMGPPTEGGQMGLTLGPGMDSGMQSAIVQQLQRLAPMLYNKGDITPDSLAKASGLYADQDHEARGLSGAYTPEQIEAQRRFRIADKGGDRYSLGAEGRLDQFGGEVDTTAPTTQATIRARQADATQSYASAGASSASARKTNQEIELGRSQYDSTRGGTVNLRTNQFTPITGPNGQPIQPKVGKGSAMSATAQKELFEAEDGRAAAENVISMLGQAKELNNKAYSGVGANLRAQVVSNLGGSKAADATVDLDNIMTVQALESLKATFGAAPTEGERKILMDIQASADKTPQQREAIINRAVAMAQKRLQFNANKARSLRQGNYFADQEGAGAGAASEGAGASGSWTGEPAAPGPAPVNRNVRVNF